MSAVAPRMVALPRGQTLIVREVKPDDQTGLEALYASLDRDDRYLRFFSAYWPDERFFARKADPDARPGFGLVAEVEGAGEESSRIVGEAGYTLLPDGDGELAMTVAEDWRGWLGPYLLDALLEGAHDRGVPNLEADVLVTNRRMISVLRRGDTR